MIIPSDNSLPHHLTSKNRVNEIANELTPKLIEYFSQFVGKKILKADGSLTKRVADGVFRDPRLRMIRGQSKFSLYYKVTFCHSADGIAHYADTYIDIGQISNGVLQSMNEPKTDRVTDYTPERVKQLKADWDRAKEVAYSFEKELAKIF